jgi:hypothetical protein
MTNKPASLFYQSIVAAARYGDFYVIRSPALGAGAAIGLGASFPRSAPPFLCLK